MKWNLSLVYNSDNEVYEDKTNVEKLIGSLDSYKSDVLSNLSLILNDTHKLELLLARMYLYNTMKYHLDLKNDENGKLYFEMETFYSNCFEHISWVVPSLVETIKTVGYEKVFSQLSDSDKDLFDYELTKINDQSQHVLSSESEKLLVILNKAKSGFDNSFTNLTVTDNVDVDIELSVGKVTVNSSNYTKLLSELENQSDRMKVFEAYYAYFKKHENTLAGIYNNILEINSKIAKLRGYDSSIEAELDQLKIPLEVYKQLTSSIIANNDIINNYNEYRKSQLHLDKYYTFDRFIKVNKSTKKYTYNEAVELCINAANSASEEYGSYMKQVLSDGRVDALPNLGKLNGAYSWGCKSSGPMILMNFNETLDSVYTLMHEGGHSIHTMLASKNQVSTKSDYPIYLAEIASTFAEAVLDDYLLENEKDPEVLKVLLEESISGKIATFVRQSAFADFELRSSKVIDSGNSLTANDLSSIMKDVYSDYYQMNLDDEELKKLVWAYIPHLYNSPFYVYKYATSLAASLAIFAIYKVDKEKGLNILFNILKSGGNKYPDVILLENGIDLSSKKTYSDVFRFIESRIEMLKEIS